MIRNFNQIFSSLNLILQYSYRDARKVQSFSARIRRYNNRLHLFDRQFHMRPPNLSSSNKISFPIKIKMNLRHRFNKNKNMQVFQDNSQKIAWNRLSPNQILLGLQNITCLDFQQIIEGLQFLSAVPDQEKHDWNEHKWVVTAFNYINKNFKKIQRKDIIKMYYLMKKLNNKNSQFWRKIYAKIQQDIYNIPPQQFQKFFMKYYKQSQKYFSAQMKQKFITLMQNRLRSFSPQNIIKIYQIYQQENKLNDYYKFNVFVPLFKNIQYNYRPRQLHKIFRFMLILNHENDDRLYSSLYSRIMKYDNISIQQIQLLQQVIAQVKDLFYSHRVDPYIEHLTQLKKKVIQKNANKKIQIPLHQLVRQDLTYYLEKKKLKLQHQQKKQNKQQNQNNSTTI